MKHKTPGKREANAAEIKNRLYMSAARVIARVGFASSSIARITEGAGVAQGTFYNYFESREAIFEELVSIFGRRMRTHIAEKTSHIDDFFERERVALRAYFEFTHDNPFFRRILPQAEIFIPQAFKTYFNKILSGYMREINRGMKSGYVRRMAKKEAEAIALVLMSARNYFGYQYAAQIARSCVIPQAVMHGYMRVVVGALAPAGRSCMDTDDIV